MSVGVGEGARVRVIVGAWSEGDRQGGGEGERESGGKGKLYTVHTCLCWFAIDTSATTLLRHKMQTLVHELKKI